MRVWTSPLQHLHTVPAGFPEIPERIRWAEDSCRDLGITPEAPAAAELSAIECSDLIRAVHLDDRLARLKEAAVPYRARIDTPDCPVSPGTPDAALAAVRLTLLGLSAVFTGPRAGLVLTRPPGHHASLRLAGGFCYLNNVAVAARAAQRLGRPRVAILDIDVHHGNGTQDIFYKDGDVFFCSLHEDPRTQYPGIGYIHELGAADGCGATMNLPFLTGTSGDKYLRDFEEQALPAIRRHRPDILLVSAGFDTHKADPLGGLALIGADFRRLGGKLAEVAGDLHVPALFVLEGGYDPLCFSDGMRPFLEGWMGR